eukprot:gene39599-52226_t
MALVHVVVDIIGPVLQQMEVMFNQILERLHTRVVTVPTSQLATPDLAEQKQELIAVPTTLELSEWPIYSVSKTEKDFYLKKLRHHFNNVNNVRYNGRFGLIKTRSHVIVKEGNRTVFRCGAELSSQRNLYLEMHNFDYDIVVWLASRYVDNDKKQTGICKERC